MDIFTLNKPSYSNGKIINGIKTALWVERYNQPGEFKFIMEPTEHNRSVLDLGTFISHSDTKTIMAVETHIIDEDTDGPVELEILGRTVDVIAMENRVAPLNRHTFSPVFTDNVSTRPWVYIMDDEFTWDEIKRMMDDFMKTNFMDGADTRENYPNINVLVGPNMGIESLEDREYTRASSLSEIIYPLLKETNVGLKLERPNTSHLTLDFILHKGVYRGPVNNSNNPVVVFDAINGDIEKARYVWSNKNQRNAAYIGTTPEQRLAARYRPTADAGWELRILPVDASDWVSTVTYPLSDAAQRSFVRRRLESRARTALGKHKLQTLIDATIAQTTSYAYGVDYEIGDRVLVRGNYGISQIMRVVEYAHVMDEDGEKGFPTLSEV